MAKLYYARRGNWGYGDIPLLDQGQVIELGGFINDEKLIRLGYLAELDKGVALVQCKFCGGRFCSDALLNSHGINRHPARPRTPEEEDALLDTIDRQQDVTAPLYLDKTAASRDGKARASRRAAAR